MALRWDFHNVRDAICDPLAPLTQYLSVLCVENFLSYTILSVFLKTFRISYLQFTHPLLTLKCAFIYFTRSLICHLCQNKTNRSHSSIHTLPYFEQLFPCPTATCKVSLPRTAVFRVGPVICHLFLSLTLESMCCTIPPTNPAPPPFNHHHHHKTLTLSLSFYSVTHLVTLQTVGGLKKRRLVSSLNVKQSKTKQKKYTLNSFLLSQNSLFTNLFTFYLSLLETVFIRLCGFAHF